MVDSFVFTFETISFANPSDVEKVSLPFESLKEFSTGSATVKEALSVSEVSVNVDPFVSVTSSLFS